VAKRLQFATEMMRADAGLHADQARRQVGKPRFHLAARPFLSQHDAAAPILANQVERVLADIDRRLDERIDALSDEIMTLARQDKGCERLMTVPGIGPIISSAMVAAIGSGGRVFQGPRLRGLARTSG
jgi:transposase